jgi:hypothetical protein
VVNEEAKKDIYHYFDEIHNEKFRTIAHRLVDLIRRKHDAMKDLQIAKKELSHLDSTFHKQ